jgi:hypothetical protein
MIFTTMKSLMFKYNIMLADTQLTATDYRGCGWWIDGCWLLVSEVIIITLLIFIMPLSSPSLHQRRHLRHHPNHLHYEKTGAGAKGSKLMK